MTLRDTLSWNLLEGRTGWGLVVVVLLISVLGITASVEKWIDPLVASMFFIVFSFIVSTLSILYTRHTLRSTEKDR